MGGSAIAGGADRLLLITAGHVIHGGCVGAVGMAISDVPVFAVAARRRVRAVTALVRHSRRFARYQQSTLGVGRCS